ncbi:MAG TPA: GAF domain-containing protein [Gemmatimonadaceae bacterium]|nr:GAF domain-containing protein [Gemmatimonadaceae bacterium]
MPPRTLAALAHALGAASTADDAFVALTEALAEIDRSAEVAVISFDARRSMLRERATVVDGVVRRDPVDTTIDHLPSRERLAITAGGAFVDFAERSEEFGRIFRLRPIPEGALLSARGIRFEGELATIVAVYEARRLFGTRASERFAPVVALFELAFARFLERDARTEAVVALEDVTRRLHGEYQRKLGEVEVALMAATGEHAAQPTLDISLAREAESAREEARRATRQRAALEQQVAAAVEQLERLHIELHRRSETLRQKIRSLYLIERVLTLAASTDDSRQLADGLLALVGDDMQAKRCSLLLRAPEPEMLYLAAARGIAPHIAQGVRTRIGQGVAGKVALHREPLLVQDVEEAKSHPLLKDEYFTTGSFISFPLVFHDELFGVVNITNRSVAGAFTEEDVERVRLLALVIALVATRANLPERLAEALSGV